MPRLRFIAPLNEGDMYARMLEVFARATITRMLPSLEITNDELLELVGEPPSATTKQTENAFESWELGDEARGNTLRDTVLYMSAERQSLIFHALSFGYVTVYHLFERQLLRVIGIMDYRHNRTVLTETQHNSKMSVPSC